MRTKVIDYKVGEKIILKSDNKIYPITEIRTDIGNGIIIHVEDCGICCSPEDVILATNENLIKIYKNRLKDKKQEMIELKKEINKLKGLIHDSHNKRTRR